MAVVKADAYGHGLQQVAGRLMHAGADLAGVANITEAAQGQRELGPGWPILLLSPPCFPRRTASSPITDLAATVSTSDEVVAPGPRRAIAAGRPIQVHLKVDTGMGRLGVWHEEAAALVRLISGSRGLRLAGIFTHFASPDDDPAFTEEQRRRFLGVLAASGLDKAPPEGLLVHADNSAGLETMPGSSPFNAVRVGLLQFGVLAPHPGSFLAQVRTEPVFFRTRVGIVKRLPSGTSVSYGRTRRLSRDSTVAVLCAGYGDGIPRSVSNKASVLIRGVRCPVLGRVTMDQTVGRHRRASRGCPAGTRWSSSGARRATRSRWSSSAGGRTRYRGRPCAPSRSASRGSTGPRWGPDPTLLADARRPEADLPQLLKVEDVAPVEDEGGLGHRLVDLCKVERLELVPFGRDRKRVRARRGLIGAGNHRQEGVDRVLAEDVPPDLVGRDLRVIDADLRLLRDQVAAHAAMAAGLPECRSCPS